MSLTKEQIFDELLKNTKNILDSKDKYDNKLIEAVATKIFNKNNTFTDEEKNLIDDFIDFNEENLSDNDSNTPLLFDILRYMVFIEKEKEEDYEGGKKSRKSRKVRKVRKSRKDKKSRKVRKSRK